MLASFGRFISRYSKAILAIWVLAMLIITPFAANSFSSTELSLTASDESSEGQEILQKYFPSTGISENPILVLSYDSPAGLQQFLGDDKTSDLATYIINWFKTDLTWIAKLESNYGIYLMDYSVSTESGVAALGFKYRATFSNDQIIDDTPALRSAVDKAITAFLSDYGVPVKYFYSHLTGDTAITYDNKDATLDTIFFAMAVVSIIAIVLMGLFFGSFLTSIISFVSLAFSAILLMAMLSLTSSIFTIQSIIWLIVMFVNASLSFAYCTLFISTYKRHVQSGMDKDGALQATVAGTVRMYLVTGVSLIVLSIVMLFNESYIIRSIGVGMFFAVTSVILVSSMVPATIISITKNELFWTRSVDGTFKSIRIEKYYRLLEGIYFKISTAVERFLDRRYVAVIAVISLAMICATPYVIALDVRSENYDLTDSVMVGDSAAGLKELDRNSMGGLFQPYSIVLECDSHIGKIVEIYDSPLTTHREFVWSSGIEDVKSEIRALEKSVAACDTDNIYSVKSLEFWSDLVADAKSHATDPDDIIAYISNKLFVDDAVAYQGFDDELTILKEKGYTSERIINECGPRMDYAMNSWLCNFGYQKISSGDVVIDYITVSAFTKRTCTSDSAFGTTGKIDKAVGEFMKDSKSFSRYWICGVAVTYDKVYGSLYSDYMFMIVMILVMTTILMWVIERNLLLPFDIIVTSAVGTYISNAVVLGMLVFFNGSVSNIIMMLVPVFTMTYSVWFSYMQFEAMKRCGSMAEAKREINPVIIVTSLVIAFASLILMFSEVSYVSQMGFTIAAMVLVDAFVVRLILVPALSKLGTERDIKFFKRYTHE